MHQALKIDAGLVHLADAQRAEIVEPLDDLATRAGTAAELLDLGVLVMLFERDDVGLLCHFCSPSYAWCRRKIEMSPGVQSRDDTRVPDGHEEERLGLHL